MYFKRIHFKGVNISSLSQHKGRWAEQLAENYLHSQGLQTVAQNYHCREGEIDLIMRQEKTIIFVEVRYRRYRKYGSSLESIDFRKQQRILIAAQYYMQSLEKSELFAYRFDAVLIEGEIKNPHIQWLKDAFRPES